MALKKDILERVFVSVKDIDGENPYVAAKNEGLFVSLKGVNENELGSLIIDDSEKGFEGLKIRELQEGEKISLNIKILSDSSKHTSI